ncbi:hypothetical protein [Alkalihalobacillus trypoxylicola]|uniref:Uncharacterized protein n=1 Tax=Alkalihalobacillus trypoxylicola TaxID=519424 RepID=A0A162DPV1_9BACI|nr:hypothetical protein [Alkalihalobacillus trypoxylicola]KYG30504.1 hypothetical protein AZF04_19690 [Alkalihalobacillus trypoxylicola]
MAFIPIANLYLMGLIAERQSQQTWKEYIPIGFTALGAISLLMNNLGGLGYIINIALLVATGYVIYLIYERYSSNAVPFLIISVLTAFLLYPILVFIIRNNSIRPDQSAPIRT